MSWATALDDLRILLSDGPTDKYNYRKATFPAPNGTNVKFKTYEFRRVTDFTMVASDLGVYVNGALVAVASDNLATGEFTLSVAPSDGDVVQATYYNQWFNNTELESFLKSASNWLAFADNYAGVPGGLIPAAKKYAASEAYLKLALRWSQMQSEQYRVEDAVNPRNQAAVDSFMNLSKGLREDATTLRDQYYTRSGQSLQPIFVTIPGGVKANQPRR